MQHATLSTPKNRFLLFLDLFSNCVYTHACTYMNTYDTCVNMPLKAEIGYGLLGDRGIICCLWHN